MEVRQDELWQEDDQWGRMVEALWQEDDKCGDTEDRQEKRLDE